MNTSCCWALLCLIFHSFAFVCVRTCMLCALYLKIALYFLFDFKIVLKICCPVMTHYPSHSVLALYIFILHQVTFMWNIDGFQRKWLNIWMWIVQCRTVNRHKYSSPMSLRQNLISNSAFLAPHWGAVVCDLNMCSMFHALIVVHFTVKF